MSRGAIKRPVLAAAGLTLVALLARAVHDRGGARRVGSLLLHRFAPPRQRAEHPAEESRLYTRRKRWVGAHLARFPDGRLAVLALPLDGSRRTSVYVVDERRPWYDFEHQARLVGAAWGPCRDATAGL